MTTRMVRALGVVLLVCASVRLGAALIGPVLPALAVVTFLVGLGYLLFMGPRARG